MRIIHLASGREWRGGERQVWLLARALHRSGDVDQMLVTARGSRLERQVQSDGVPVQAVPWSLGLDPRVLPVLLRLPRHVPFLIHAHDSHALLLGLLAARRLRVPLIATRRVTFPVSRRSPWRRAERIVAVSHAVRDSLVADGLSPHRIAVVHSGVDLESSQRVSPMDVRARLGLPPTARIAANVAALERHKNHALLVGAARAIRSSQPDLHWVIAGTGEQGRAVAAEISAAGLADRVHLLGEIPEGAALTAAADVFVMTSSSEGLGTSVIEALSLGVPVVATAAGGLPELLEGGAGLLCPESPLALADAVTRVLTDEKERARLRSAGTERAQGFSHVRMATGLRSVYRSVVPDA
jgi:glycosyltransferase involved in cell wall biosynthesis